MTQNDKNKNKNYKSDTNNTTVDPNNKYNDNDTINNSNDSYDEFIIPKNSFTSFRLKYSDPKQIYMNSLSISIGPIPHIWILDKKKDSLRNLIFKLKSSNDFKSSKISSHDVRHQFSKHLDKDYNSLPQINFDHINIEKENIARKQFIPNINDNNNISETPAITEPDNNKISKEKSKSHIKETKSDSEFLKNLDKNFNNHKDYNDSFMDRSERFTKELNSKLHEKKEKLSNSDVNDSNSFHHHSRNGQLDSKPQKLYIYQKLIRILQIPQKVTNLKVFYQLNSLLKISLINLKNHIRTKIRKKVYQYHYQRLRKVYPPLIPIQLLKRGKTKKRH
ncbi:unnamed protein product [[Candida] boidinii]|nr:unnamed protein product [[Candida] boidinii]